MSRSNSVFLWFLAGIWLAGITAHAEERTRAEMRSGLQVGEKITSIFEPLNVSGPFKGERHCLVCENGLNPVAMVFAREISPPLVKLLVELDAATGKHKSQEMGSFLVLLSDAADQPDKLAELGRKHQLKHLILSVDDPPGPEGFAVAPESAITVMLYKEFEVLANHAFRPGELTEDAVRRIIADVPKIVGAKETHK